MMLGKNETKKLVDILRKGGIIIYPTETAYGFGADATNISAIRKIQAVKKRDSKKPMLVIMSSSSMVKRYVKLNNIAIMLMNKFMPGPLTLVCDGKRLPEKEGVGFRISSDKFVQRLVKEFGKPIISTSVNRSGDPPLYNIKKIRKMFEDKVDAIVNAGNLRKDRLSTVFDTRTLETIREGSVSERNILRTINPFLKVLCGGCFNRLHNGHIYFLKKVKSYGGHLTVVVANDSRNRRKYGIKAVSAAIRKKMIEKTRIADSVLIGSKNDIFGMLKKIKPNIIAIGHDQTDIPKKIVNRYKLKIVRIGKVNRSKKFL